MSSRYPYNGQGYYINNNPVGYTSNPRVVTRPPRQPARYVNNLNRKKYNDLEEVIKNVEETNPVLAQEIMNKIGQGILYSTKLLKSSLYFLNSQNPIITENRLNFLAGYDTTLRKLRDAEDPLGFNIQNFENGYFTLGFADQVNRVFHLRVAYVFGFEIAYSVFSDDGGNTWDIAVPSGPHEFYGTNALNVAEQFINNYQLNLDTPIIFNFLTTDYNYSAVTGRITSAAVSGDYYNIQVTFNYEYPDVVYGFGSNEIKSFDETNSTGVILYNNQARQPIIRNEQAYTNTTNIFAVNKSSIFEDDIYLPFDELLPSQLDRLLEIYTTVTP